MKIEIDGVFYRLKNIEYMSRIFTRETVGHYEAPSSIRDYVMLGYLFHEIPFYYDAVHGEAVGPFLIIIHLRDYEKAVIATFQSIETANKFRQQVIDAIADISTSKLHGQDVVAAKLKS